MKVVADRAPIPPSSSSSAEFEEREQVLEIGADAAEVEIEKVVSSTPFEESSEEAHIPTEYPARSLKRLFLGPQKEMSRLK